MEINYYKESKINLWKSVALVPFVSSLSIFEHKTFNGPMEKVKVLAVFFTFIIKYNLYLGRYNQGR